MLTALKGKANGIWQRYLLMRTFIVKERGLQMTSDF